MTVDRQDGEAEASVSPSELRRAIRKGHRILAGVAIRTHLRRQETLSQSTTQVPKLTVEGTCPSDSLE